MMRREDWPEVLHSYVEAAQARPFSWGRHDCGTFAAGAVEVMTGVNPMADMDPYDRRGARAHMERGLHGEAAKRLGPAIAPLFAQRGDVVGFLWRQRQTLGICIGQHIAALGPEGLVMVPLTTAVCAWRV